MSTPPPPLKQAHPIRTGCIFLGAYLAVIALIVVFVATAGGHMSPLLLVFPALPWPLLGHWLVRTDGVWVGTLVGLPLNAALAFAAGYGLARWRARR